METSIKESPTRIIFLDNLRYFFVLCVVLQHASNAYGGLSIMGNWWPVLESKTSSILGTLNGFLNGFTMPLLFYIAGYFALPIIQKRGIFSFIKGKLKRLGVPWVVCIITICPILQLVYHYTRDGLTLSRSYFDLWIILTKNFMHFNIGIIPSMNELISNDGFYQRYMWFVSLLLLFFLIFSIIYKLKKRWFNIEVQASEQNPSIISNLKLLGVLGLLSYIGSVIAVVISALFIKRINPTAWFTLGNIIQFNVSSFPIYIIYFGLGIITYRYRWIGRGIFPGHFKFWTISFIILSVISLYFMHGMLSSPSRSHEQAIYGTIFGFIYSFSLVATLGFASSLAIRYWNRPRKFDKSLASNSYDIYLSHYIFVLIFQLILFTIPGIPVLLKFAAVSALSIICAYLVSQFLIKPFPKLTAALLFIMLIIMFIVIKP